MYPNNRLSFSLISFFFLSIFLSGQQGVVVSAHSAHHLYRFRPSKLFVFGDSYSDTGNNRKSISSSWKYPYGITFPGKPSGRYSDGRVLTDFVARFIGVKTPVAYQWRKVVEANQLKNGMNFAYGGTGVFDTAVKPNMTNQIDYFERLIKEKLYTPKDLNSSVALVTVSGNDYAYYIARNGSTAGFPAFINSVVNQLHVNLKRLRDLGVKKIALTSLQPLGCLPVFTANSSFTVCSASQNTLVQLHNVLLQSVVAKLNNETRSSPFLILNLYDSFTAVLNNTGDKQGIIKFEDPLRPCCIGTSSKYFCGSVDEAGEKKYTICKQPQSTFFWDYLHPTEQGWRAIYSILQNSLQQLVY